MAWYLDFKGPEVLTQAMLFLSIFFYFTRKPWAALLSVVIAAQQNPSVTAWVLMPIYQIIQSRKWKNFIFIISIMACILFPSIFNYVLFGKANIMVSETLDKANITWRRLSSAFFDPQQGVIVGYFATIPIYLLLAIRRIKFNDFSIIFFIIISVVMFIPLMAQNNWHPGQIRMLRYGAWIGMIFHASAPFIFNLALISLERLLIVLLFTANIIYYIYTNFIFQENYYYCDFNKVSRYILQKHPTCYNPDIEIFAECTYKYEKDFSQDSIIVFQDPKSHKIKKLAVKLSAYQGNFRDSLQQLFENSFKIYYAEKGWAYLSSQD